MMARAFAELRDGIVARQHEERFQIWAPLEACVDRSGQSLFAFAVWVVVGESYRKAVKYRPYLGPYFTLRLCHAFPAVSRLGRAGVDITTVHDGVREI